MQNAHSNFWIGNFNNDIDVLTGKVDTGKDYVKLASTLRAVSNFVNIVTGKNIPVRYHGKDSYTDGKSITISSNVKDKNFDCTVGLALHEGSHVKLSDFVLLNSLQTILKEDDRVDFMASSRYRVQDILNYVEDRRIDCYIYTNAPGYKPYYKAMYDTYFHSKSVDKGLKSTEYRTENWDSYMFRMINITNSNRDLDALKGLREIWTLLDLGNVERLETTRDALEVALDIFTVINRYVLAAEAEGTEESEEKKDEDGNCEGDRGEVIDGNRDESLDGETKSDEATTPEGEAESDDGSEAEGEDSKDTTPGEFDLNDKEKRQLSKAIEKQKEFGEGKAKKSSMSRHDKRKVEAIKDSGASLKTVGEGANSHWNYNAAKSIKCVVVEKLNQKIVDSNIYDCVLYNPEWFGASIDRQQEDIHKGVRLGTMLGRKLQVRNQDNSIKYNRLRSGKIDRRAIASLGFGAEAVFEKVLTTSHNAACLHISIDASGSMSGERWNNSQIAAVAIAKAASMTSNMDVVISYRSIFCTTNTTHQPLIMIAYDSRKDSFNKITSLFKYLRPGGSTPAGLCFEAILDKINTMGNNASDRYFINFSDGAPYFNSGDFTYSGDIADTHTKAQVDKMKAAGVKVLSYYVDGNDLETNGRGRKSFDRKYGKGCTAYVSVTDIVPLAKTLNNTFIQA